MKPSPAMERSASTSRTAEKNIGVIGLGIIGCGIAAHLRRTGYSVFVWNRSPRAVPNFVGSPGELAELCNYMQIFVSDDQALLQTVEQLSEHLTSRHMILAHSTVAPDSMRAAAQIVERRRARFVEASFTGSKPAAEKGELIYYVGGTDSALREARPILQASSKEIIEIGGVGDASAVKIATNMITAATIQAAAEALGLVRALGLPMEKFIEAMRPNASYSGTLAMKLPKMISRDFDPQFSVKHMLKDMQLACHIALSHYLDLGVTAAARDQLLEQTQWGHGDDDYSVVARKYLQDAAAESHEQQQQSGEQARQAEENEEIASSPESEAETMSPKAAAVDTSEQPLVKLAEAGAVAAPTTAPLRRGFLKQLLSRLSPGQE
ncbi:MAG TPA: NAD(P)-dependent oxidoreductase [Candidatus Udaeobacter sp.]|nr:NAD(P)-dependent oxidoreductase [Candidatus Udaeobacter sp.]